MVTASISTRMLSCQCHVLINNYVLLPLSSANIYVSMIRINDTCQCFRSSTKKRENEEYHCNVAVVVYSPIQRMGLATEETWLLASEYCISYRRSTMNVNSTPA